MAPQCELEWFDDPRLNGEWKLSLPLILLTWWCLLVSPDPYYREITASPSQFPQHRSLLLLVRLERMAFWAAKVGNIQFFILHNLEPCPSGYTLWSCSALLATLLKCNACKLRGLGPAGQCWCTEACPAAWPFYLSCRHLGLYQCFGQPFRRRGTECVGNSDSWGYVFKIS